MRPYVALLKAVNLGGSTVLRMADLAAMCERLGLEAVRTHLASGNVTFRAPPTSHRDLERRLEQQLARDSGLRTTAFVRSEGEWTEIIRNNPFPAAARSDPGHLLVAVLKGETGPAGWSDLSAAVAGPEQVVGHSRHGYLVYPNGIGRSKLTTAHIERHLGTQVTSRNWNTTLRIATAFAR